MRRLEPPTGHVFRRDGARRSTWYAKYRLPDGRQVQKRIGPAWTERGRPATGHYTKRTAEAWLRDVLEEATRTLPGLVQTSATFADAAAEFLRYVEHDRAIKPSTLTDYRSIVSAHLVPAFGAMRVEEVTPEKIERWRATVTSAEGSPLSNRTKNKLLVLLHGVFRRAQKVYGLSGNPVAGIEGHPQRSSGDIQVFSVEEVYALVRAATSNGTPPSTSPPPSPGCVEASSSLRWRDVDFAAAAIRVRASYAGRALATPKSARVRSVPLAPDVAEALARLGQRGHATRDDDLVFLGDAGAYLDASALRRRYDRALKRADLRPLRFHDLRHTFGTRMIARADIRRVQEWMGHADVQTTMRYLHYAPGHDDAALVADAFRRDGLSEARQLSETSG